MRQLATALLLVAFQFNSLGFATRRPASDERAPVSSKTSYQVSPQVSPQASPKGFPNRVSGAPLVSIGRNQGAFLMLSDIHFDPFADPALVPGLAAAPAGSWASVFESSRNHALARNSRDSSYWLLASAIAAARSSGVSFDYVLVTGDYLAHDLRSKYRAQKLADQDFPDFAIKTMVFVSSMIQNAFPGIPIVGVIGNNDSTCDDYAEPPRSALFSRLATEWNVVATRPDAARDLASGGFYAIPHPVVPRQDLIILNSVFWSTHYHPGCSTIPGRAVPDGDPGALQMAWLERKLEESQSAGHTAVLIMHIPPGMDSFNSAAQSDCNKPISFWKAEYAEKFQVIIERHKKILRDSYAGHLHRDDFRVFTDDGAPFLQMHIAPAISPIYLNNPAFEIGLYDKASGALADYTAVYLKNYKSAGKSESPDWSKEYAFRQAYNAPDVSPASLATLAAGIEAQPAIRERFLDFYAAHDLVVSILATKDWPFYACAETQIGTTGFAGCACPAPGSK